MLAGMLASNAAFAVNYTAIPSPGNMVATASSTYIPDAAVKPGNALNFAPGVKFDTPTQGIAGLPSEP